MAILGYNKKPGSNVWESIPTLELKDIVNATNPKEAGEDDGANDIPASTDTELSKTEQAIICQAEEYLQTIHELATKEKSDAHRRINDLSITQPLEDFSDIKNSPDAEFNSYIAETKPELTDLKVQEKAAFVSLRYFKSRNNLVSPASYPNSMFLHFGILMIFLLGESIANMYFFAAGSTLGLLGGFFEATLVSLANIALSYVVGMFVIVQFNHRSNARKAIAATITVMYLAAITVFHLLVAHYRDLLATNPDNATVMVWSHFIDGPFSFDTMESAMVLLIGVVIAVLSCNKGYRHDDPYPGYGKVTRVHIDRNAQFNNKLKEVTKKLSSIILSSKNELNSRLSTYEDRIKKMKDIYHGLESVAAQFATIKNTLDTIVDTSISIYRNTNREVRITPPPAFFQDKVTISDKLSEDKDFFNLDAISHTIKDSENQLLELRKKAAQVEQYLANKSHKVTEEIEDIYALVDNNAKTIVDELIDKVSTGDLSEKNPEVYKKTPEMET